MKTMNLECVGHYENSISHKLYISFSEYYIPLSEAFICFICFGILVDPLKCSICKLVCCKNCLLKIHPRQKVFCDCGEEMKKGNFTTTHIQNLDETIYLIYLGANLRNKKYKYNDAIEKFLVSKNYFPNYFRAVQESRYVKSYSYYHVNEWGDFEIINRKKKIGKKKEKERIKRFQQIMNKEENTFRLRKTIGSKKITKMFKFNYTKGFNYNQFNSGEDVAPENSIFIINNCRIKSIDISNAIYSRHFVIELAKLIRNNKKYLQKVNLGLIENASYVVFRYALSFCPLLKTLQIGESKLSLGYRWFFEESENYSFEFMFYLKSLQKLVLNGFIILNNQKMEYFASLSCLDSITLEYCSIQFSSFISFMGIILKLKLLKSIEIKFIEILTETSPLEYENIFLYEIEGRGNSKEQKFKELFMQNDKFELFHYQDVVRIRNSDDCLRLYYIDEDFIQRHSHFGFSFNNLKIPLADKILDLELVTSSYEISQNLKEEFAKYLIETKYLKKLSLFYYSFTDKYFIRSILKSLSENDSIVLLDLSHFNLSSYLPYLIKLIRNNHKIKILNLYECNLILSEDFAESLVNNDSLQELNARNNFVLNSEKVIPLMMKSKLHKIYLKFWRLQNIPSNIVNMIDEDQSRKIEVILDYY